MKLNNKSLNDSRVPLGTFSFVCRKFRDSPRISYFKDKPKNNCKYRGVAEDDRQIHTFDSQATNISTENNLSTLTSTYGNTTEACPNWSGYYIKGNGFTKISGDWTVPSISAENVTNTSDEQDSSTWIGIGGADKSTKLIQMGTDQDRVYENDWYNDYHPWWDASRLSIRKSSNFQFWNFS